MDSINAPNSRISRGYAQTNRMAASNTQSAMASTTDTQSAQATAADTYSTDLNISNSSHIANIDLINEGGMIAYNETTGTTTLRPPERQVVSQAQSRHLHASHRNNQVGADGTISEGIYNMDAMHCGSHPAQHVPGADTLPEAESKYQVQRMIGNGSFGVVHEAIHVESGNKVAIKKVLQDPRYKNRELSIMLELSHPNIVYMFDHFYTEVVREQETQIYLNIVMEFVPGTVHRMMRSYFKRYNQMPIALIKVYAFQLCKALGYLHAVGVCHRDLKPHNLLVDLETNVLKLCDFGSAKKLRAGEMSVAYICSRFYRAPELMLGATEYTTAIDIWSIGCVIGELLMGKPMFAGDTSIDQLVKIIQVLGTPTIEQMYAMHPNYQNVTFPNIRAADLTRLFPTNTPPVAIDFVSQFLRYDPKERLRPLEALGHDFFNDILHNPNSNIFVPKNLLEFTQQELSAMSENTKRKLGIVHQ
ncbi:protein kinase domain containing protein [Babesia bovis T2Bo]|uniref:Protein kinase domain containing protein n=1 Tax=Babesia bovis TaxID=5865 RepID=A7AMZ0_BABBO|nr:protein kinase domain containing protein [Babesia bovis T2Bo]EDO07924.1 protein kinase domain containing protein [Babesia bovis T2Bo]|eukprot:XP_001611492.1 protein kinase domain containing protein [Babesia bovis T2Bo]